MVGGFHAGRMDVFSTTLQFDPPEGTPRPEYDMILRLVPKNAPATGLRLATPWGGPVIDPMAFDSATTNASVLVAGYCAACHGPDWRAECSAG
jgi:mono/diheme cytochrome c family protein